MILARLSKKSDPLGRYYTDALIGECLVRSMNVTKPKNVLDLGAGSGILVQAASKIWTRSNFYTVDIDKKACSATFPDIHGNKFKHHIADVLDLSLAEKLGLGWAQADAAICNPPYLLPKWMKHFGEILEDAGFSQFVPKSGDISADFLFIAQNLRMLKSGGKLGLILPDGIVAGEKYRPLRKALIDMHCIEKVIELPRKAFRNTEAKAHIVILSKNSNSNEYIKVSKILPDGRVSEEISAPTENFSKRLDYSYIKGSKKFKGKNIISDVTVETFRGTISSSERHLTTIPIFHTTDFDHTNKYVPKKFYLQEKNRKSCTYKVATTGDILIARVGRNLNEKVCMVYNKGLVPISDCVIVLRVKKEYRRKLFEYLKSPMGKQSIEAGTKGVGAKFVTVDSIGEIKF